MQFGNRRNEAEAEPAARRRARLLQPIQAVENLATLRLWNAWTIVGDDHPEPGLAVLQRNTDRRARRTVADGVLDQIGEQPDQQLAVAVYDSFAFLRQLDRELVSCVVDDRPVNLGHLRHDRLQAQRPQPLAPRTGLDLRDAQQRLERFDDDVDLLQRRLDLAAEFADAPRRSQRHVELLSQPPDRALQIVRDIARRLVDALDQSLQLV